MGNFMNRSQMAETQGGEPANRPLIRPPGTLSPTGGEGWDEGEASKGVLCVGSFGRFSRAAVLVLAALLISFLVVLGVPQTRAGDVAPATNSPATGAQSAPGPTAPAQIRQRWLLGGLIVTLLGIRVYYRSRKK